MRKLLGMLAVAGGLVVGMPTTSSAGGWVVVSLDEVPAVHAGEDTEIGFTALRHGTTPERADDLAVVVTGPSGSYHRFEAAQQGAPGHYVATITLPEEGQHTWKVTGTFVDAELGNLAVTSTADGAPDLGVGRRPVGHCVARRGDGGSCRPRLPPNSPRSSDRCRPGVMPRRAVYVAAAIAAATLSLLAAAARPDAGEEVAALDGESLFTTKGCATCHNGPDGVSMIGVGPSLADAPTWAGERVDGLSAEEYVEQSMRNPSAFISPVYRSSGGPNEGMPLLQLSDDEIDALVDYLLAR